MKQAESTQEIEITHSNSLPQKRGWPKGKPRKPRINKKEAGQVIASVAEELSQLSTKLHDLSTKIKGMDAVVAALKGLGLK
jgi:hypothetical protein